MEVDNELLEKMLKAIIFCMDYPLSHIDDDDEYSDKVDLQNELRDYLNMLELEDINDNDPYHGDD